MNLKTVIYADEESGMVLDAATHERYLRILADDPTVDREAGGVWNHEAGAWCASLRLSELQPNEAPPPVGHVGQYGHYGCVLMESAHGLWDDLDDVCFFVYEEGNSDRFLRELMLRSATHIEASEVGLGEVSTSINELHTISFYDPERDADEPAAPPSWQTDVAAALAWGERHAWYVPDPLEQ